MAIEFILVAIEITVLGVLQVKQSTPFLNMSVKTQTYVGIGDFIVAVAFVIIAIYLLI